MSEENTGPQFFNKQHEYVVLDNGMMFYPIKRMDLEQKKAADQLTKRNLENTEKFKDRPNQMEMVVQSFKEIQMIDTNESLDFYEGARSTLSTVMALFYLINSSLKDATGKGSAALSAAVDTFGGMLIRVHELTTKKEIEVFGGPRNVQETRTENNGTNERTKFVGLIEQEAQRIQARGNNKK